MSAPKGADRTTRIHSRVSRERRARLLGFEDREDLDLEDFAFDLGAVFAAGIASFSSTCLSLIVCIRFSSALLAEDTLAKVTNPNPRDFIVSRLYMTWADSTGPKRRQ